MTVRNLTDEQIEALRVVVDGPAQVASAVHHGMIYLRDARALELAGLITVRPVDGMATAFPTEMGRSVLAAIDRAPAQKGIVVS